jgi:hypothetical protein
VYLWHDSNTKKKERNEISKGINQIKQTCHTKLTVGQVLMNICTAGPGIPK